MYVKEVKVAGLLVCYNGKPFSAGFKINFPTNWLCMWICAAINTSAKTSHMPRMGTSTHLYTWFERGNSVLSILPKDTKGARPLVGFEPATLGLFVECSNTEPRHHICSSPGLVTYSPIYTQIWQNGNLIDSLTSSSPVTTNTTLSICALYFSMNRRTVPVGG